ncbi:hypothetical protein HERIO_945 [Hepatospora eriocheir]|uniref:Uncharacterized protein n=1 Tax=Hepatospora eriocheir TaxID=1081669 RepID=A0A1X0QBJ9_9MICR|nr:hypothetical protein HERIO_945 [Hepatospora eriocheir]
MKNDEVSSSMTPPKTNNFKIINPFRVYLSQYSIHNQIKSKVSKCIEILKKEFGEDEIEKIEKIANIFLREIVRDFIKNNSSGVLLFDPLNNLSRRNTEYYDLILYYLKKEKILIEDDGSDVYIILKEACKHSKDEFIDSVKILKHLFDVYNFYLINTGFNNWYVKKIFKKFN